MNINDQTRFNQLYQAYLNELTLQGKSPKTLDMYSRCIRQVSVFFDTQDYPYMSPKSNRTQLQMRMIYISIDL